MYQYLCQTAVTSICVDEKLETLESITLLELEPYALFKVIAELSFLVLVQNPTLCIELKVAVHSGVRQGKLRVWLHLRLQVICEALDSLLKLELIVVFPC